MRLWLSLILKGKTTVATPPIELLNKWIGQGINKARPRAERKGKEKEEAKGDVPTQASPTPVAPIIINVGSQESTS